MVLERIENSASLHGSSVANHHVCLLVKSCVSLLILGGGMFTLVFLGPLCREMGHWQCMQSVVTPPHIQLAG